ncbi:MAG: LysR family transcriptional regulator [Parvibaculaceae bacterium]|nr:LysR family transcriptional regulator [Parvibaculaceae bacterium]
MEKRDLDWTFYRSFLAVMRHGSLSAAAHALKLTQPTLGRHVDGLEAGLGTSLFTRSRMGLTPTDAALALMPHAEAMEAAVAAFTRAASGEAQDARGTVRLTTSQIMGAEVLPPFITEFRQRHPHIDIELNLDDRQQDLLRRDADIALRMARPTQTALIARKVGVLKVKLYAHQDYLKNHTLPDTVEDLAHHTVIGYDANPRIFELLDQDGLGISRKTFSLRSDSELAQLALLRAGAGIGGAQMGIAERTRELVPILHNQFGFDMEMWLAHHEDLKSSLRVRLLYNFLAEKLIAYGRTSGTTRRA